LTIANQTVTFYFRIVGQESLPERKDERKTEIHIDYDAPPTHVRLLYFYMANVVLHLKSAQV